MKRLQVAVLTTAVTTTAAVLGMGNRALLQPVPPQPPAEKAPPEIPNPGGTAPSAPPASGQPNLSPEDLALPIEDLSLQNQSALLEMASGLVIQKFEGASCDELTTLLSPSDQENQSADPQAAMQEKAIALLKQNPDIRTAFLNQIAPPIANKMFDCNVIP